MPVYARNDLLSVHISPQHGGCGEVHLRPTHADDRPLTLWELTCHHGCEDVLRADTSWSSTPTGVPETPDEEAVRVGAEKRTERERSVATTDALQELSRLGDLPNVIGKLTELITDKQGSVAGIEVKTCPDGHRNHTSARFCSECGHHFERPHGAVLKTDTVSRSKTLEMMTMSQLRALARRNNIKSARSRVEQLKLLEAELPSDKH